MVDLNLLKFRGIICGTNIFIASNDIYVDIKFGAVEIAKMNVNPQTVGRFTGVQDMNNEDIYEGDILLNTKYNTLLLVGWSGTAFYLYREGANGKFNKVTNWKQLSDCVIYGNIHQDVEKILKGDY